VKAILTSILNADFDLKIKYKTAEQKDFVDAYFVLIRDCLQHIIKLLDVALW